MTDTAVTVVRCRQCRGSAALTLHDGRFWCADCQAWAPLAAEHHRVPGEPAEPAQHARTSAPAPRRQPLRVPPGWHIEYHEWYEGELASPELQQDLLLATHAGRDRVLDLSWYYGDGDAARYRLAVWARHEPEQQLHVVEHEAHPAAVAAVEDALATIAAGRL